MHYVYVLLISIFSSLIAQAKVIPILQLDLKKSDWALSCGSIKSDMNILKVVTTLLSTCQSFPQAREAAVMAWQQRAQEVRPEDLIVLEMLQAVTLCGVKDIPTACRLYECRRKNWDSFNIPKEIPRESPAAYIKSYRKLLSDCYFDKTRRKDVCEREMHGKDKKVSLTCADYANWIANPTEPQETEPRALGSRSMQPKPYTSSQILTSSRAATVVLPHSPMDSAPSPETTGGNMRRVLKDEATRVDPKPHASSSSHQRRATLMPGWQKALIILGSSLALTGTVTAGVFLWNYDQAANRGYQMP